jgi:hypothetical protein
LNRNSTTSPSCESVIGWPSFGFGHLALDIGLVAFGSGFFTLGRFCSAFLMLALLLLSVALAFVGALLAVVCHQLALIRDPFPLISDAVTIVSAPLSAAQLILAPRDCIVVLARLLGCGIGRVGISLSDDDSPSSLASAVHTRYAARLR